MIDTSCRRLLHKPFPEFHAASLLDAERRISKKDLLGRPTLVNVWATWCPTCKSEHDELLRIAAGTDVRLVGSTIRTTRP